MRYTLGQAARKLQAVSHAFGVTDVRDSINRAIETLSGMSGWECLRHVIRFISAGPCFALPQGAAGLVRVCVNGVPSTVRGQDFRFLHSGPGDLRSIPCGFTEVKTKNIIDLGECPVMVEPRGEFRIFATSDGTSDCPGVTVTGLTPSGRRVSRVIQVSPAPVYGTDGEIETGCEPDDVIPDQVEYVKITGVVIDPQTDSYVTLWAEGPDKSRQPIAVYHPYVTSPMFRRFAISDVTPGPCEVLAEVRIDPLPLVRDSDQLPFDGIDPIEWIIRADWCMKSNEVDTAQKYQAQAVQWMKSKEIANDTIQTPILVNSIFDGSLGQMSADAFNV